MFQENFVCLAPGSQSSEYDEVCEELVALAFRVCLQEFMSSLGWVSGWLACSSLNVCGCLFLDSSLLAFAAIVQYVLIRKRKTEDSCYSAVLIYFDF